MLSFKTIRLIWTFYRSFVFASIVVTIFCLSLFWTWGFSIFMGIFWLKLVTLAITYYFINDYKSREYYYYQNLGVPRWLLWTVSLSFDLLLFILLIIYTYQFR